MKVLTDEERMHEIKDINAFNADAIVLDTARGRQSHLHPAQRAKELVEIFEKKNGKEKADNLRLVMKTRHGVLLGILLAYQSLVKKHFNKMPIDKLIKFHKMIGEIIEERDEAGS